MKNAGRPPDPAYFLRALDGVFWRPLDSVLSSTPGGGFLSVADGSFLSGFDGFGESEAGRAGAERGIDTAGGSACAGVARGLMTAGVSGRPDDGRRTGRVGGRLHAGRLGGYLGCVKAHALRVYLPLGKFNSIDFHHNLYSTRGWQSKSLNVAYGPCSVVSLEVYLSGQFSKLVGAEHDLEIVMEYHRIVFVALPELNSDIPRMMTGKVVEFIPSIMWKTLSLLGCLIQRGRTPNK